MISDVDTLIRELVPEDLDWTQDDPFSDAEDWTQSIHAWGSEGNYDNGAVLLINEKERLIVIVERTGGRVDRVLVQEVPLQDGPAEEDIFNIHALWLATTSKYPLVLTYFAVLGHEVGPGDHFKFFSQVWDYIHTRITTDDQAKLDTWSSSNGVLNPSSTIH